MGYIDEKVPPKRDERLRVCHAYGGTVCGLVNDSRQGCLVNRDRSFSQTSNCQMGLALAMILTVPNTVTIMHAPVGCGGSSHGMDGHFRNGVSIRGEKPKSLIWFSTNLDENDVINGGEQKLEEAILLADRRHRPKAIFVVSCCAPGIIGDDIDSVAKRLQNQVMAAIIPLHCEGFKTKISATAYDVVYHGIARNLLGKAGQGFTASAAGALREETQRKQRQERTVNLFNVYSIGYPDEVELTRLLRALGLEVRYYPNFADPERYGVLTEAALNVSICATHDDYFLKHLEERYGMPYMINTMPIGIRNTNEWLLDIAKPLQREAEVQRLIEAETRELDEALAPLRQTLRGKRVYLSGGEMRVAATAMLLQELGCEIIGFRAHHYDEFGDNLYLKATEGQPQMEVNVATTQPFELVNLLRRAQPDLYLGHSGSNLWAAKLGIPTLPIFSAPQSYLGYRGVFEVAQRAARLMENPAFQRRLKENTRQPYREAWYDTDPYRYITG